MMVPKILYQGQPGAVDTDLYVVPAGKKATVTSIIVANTDAATKYFTLHVVQNGDTVADDVVLCKMQKLDGTGSVGGGGFMAIEVPFPLANVGDKISGVQETATAVTVTVIGIEEAV